MGKRKVYFFENLEVMDLLGRAGEGITLLSLHYKL
jgi:hypothetical protein